MKKILILSIVLIRGILFAEMEFFPGGSIATNPHSALLRSPEITVLYVQSNLDGAYYWEYHIGAKIPVLEYKGNEIQIQTGGYGALYPRFELYSESFNYVHQDFLGGLFFDIQYGALTAQTTLYHVSSHIGDDYLYYEDAQYENNGYEAIKQYVSYRLKKMSDITLGFEYKTFRRPEEKIFYNKSCFVGNFIDLMRLGLPLFMEWEIEIIDFKHTPNFGIKLGAYLSPLANGLLLDKKTGRGQHELSVYYYYGYSKLGYFYNKKESLLLIGPTYRL